MSKSLFERTNELICIVSLDIKLFLQQNLNKINKVVFNFISYLYSFHEKY